MTRSAFSFQWSVEKRSSSLANFSSASAAEL